MDKMQELAIIEDALEALEEEEGDYSINDVADLVGLPIRVVREHIYYAGYRPEWVKLGNKRSLLGYWELND